MATMGQNIKATVNGNILTLEIDLSVNLGPSSSGKSDLIATTNGNVRVPFKGDIMAGINIYAKRNGK